ncbi:heterokaryon incompatibility protein-domain-containing protein [Lasiosphaeria ovina]|uniref:Heterokaryon incompatibility protein-domain-containing protein n=1 Tax=Lasiosphaeria ovina TaxID=92902 RepID=A0AAE0NIH1_9PEZI|nr:heterokaryon incompatibility protein-domain-containing protein [Lasiosphaeria ovina]
MRLINVSTLEIQEFYGADIPPYAILSHRWGRDEVTLPEMAVIAKYRLDQQKRMPQLPHPTDKADTLKAGYAKITYACEQATRDGHRYLWVDTCCIDRSSSAEVSEAINSMFTWYQRAAVCYAYLEDVSKDSREGYRTWKDGFAESVWFTRGWTLQELLAPRNVVFYGKGWKLLGTKSALAKTIEKATKIDELTLLEPRLMHKASVARRMAWAAGRTTTRTEDAAYSLLGIFGINMMPLYGEGENAFLRLQEEIIRRSDDHTIFAWGTLGHDNKAVPHYHHFHLMNNSDSDDDDDDDDNDSNDGFDHEGMSGGTMGVLAKSPSEFAGMERVAVPAAAKLDATQRGDAVDFAMTNKGLRIKLSLIPVSGAHATSHKTYIGVLNCQNGDDDKNTTNKKQQQADVGSRAGILVAETETPNVLLRTRTKQRTWVTGKELVGAPRPRVVYIANGAATPLRADQSEEIVWVKAHDLTAPGYDIVDVRARGVGAAHSSHHHWNREFGTLRLAGIADRGVLYQLAAVVFFNKHLQTGFVLRILVDSSSDACFVDLLPPRRPSKKQHAAAALLKEQAQQVWDAPGKVQGVITDPAPPAAVVPSDDSDSDAPARPPPPRPPKTREIEITNPEVYGAEEEESSWTARALSAAKKSGAAGDRRSPTRGVALQLTNTVTFAEPWEKEYQRTVEAKVSRKRRGVMVLSLSAMLWDAGTSVKKVEDEGDTEDEDEDEDEDEE